LKRNLRKRNEREREREREKIKNDSAFSIQFMSNFCSFLSDVILNRMYEYIILLEMLPLYVNKVRGYERN